MPLSTYRLQLTRSFGFRDAEKLLPYLDALGVTDVYLSPPFSAAPGSAHGYDVADYNELSPELGGAEGFDALARAASARQMGIIVDIVANHMGIGPANPWWMDVLENGPSSVFAAYFDVDWKPVKPELANKVLVPVLGDQYGAVLERGELRLERQGGAFFVRYFDHAFPIAPRAVPMLLGHGFEALRDELGAQDVDVQELESILASLGKLSPRDEVSPDAVIERAREKEVAKRRLAALFDKSPRIVRFVDDNLGAFNGTPGDPSSFDNLAALLDAQAYRLAYWRVAGEEINYRRFFDVNSLAAIRMEDERVFADAHRLLGRLIEEGKVAGLRIDHPDGLYAPSAYLARLKEAWPRLYVVVEKILEPNEPMPETWNVDGTTGYEFMNMLNGLFIDGRNAGAFSDLYARFIGARQDWKKLVVDKKRALLFTSMASELSMLAHRLSRIAESDRRTRDFTLRGLQSAIAAYMIRLPVYRTYVDGELTARDKGYIDAALRSARRESRFLNKSIYDFLRATLMLESPTEASREFVKKLQQLTAPVMAKAKEDCAFYIYNRLISLNEVGGDPETFGVTVEEFHRHNEERLRRSPGSLNATSTHDTKRGEDVRLRINALSEIPSEWDERLHRWAQLLATAKREVDGELAPDANDELHLYQTLVGSLPDDEVISPEYRERLTSYLDKAWREAKVHTSWTNPDDGYEEATRAFVDAALSSRAFLDDFVPFARRVAHAARLSSLAQTALKLASPGVPDIYQGCELWNLSLVDPDNRRPVDFALRRRMLEEIGRAAPSELVAPSVLADGRAKLLVLQRGLSFRRRHPALLREGEYLPLAVAGDEAAHVVAFARALGDDHLICVVPRLLLSLGKTAPSARVKLPPTLSGPFVDLVTGARQHVTDGALDVPALLADFPVALLSRSQV